MDGTGDHVKQNRPDSQGQVSCVLCHMWNLGKKKKDMKIKGEREKKRKGDKRG
jgi:hypothetical protein